MKQGHEKMANQSLKEWIVQYRKHRDLVFRKIANIAGEDPILITNKDNTQEQIYIRESCNTFTEFNKETLPTTAVVLNTDANIRTMLKEWDTIAANMQLTIMFVNPSSQGEKRWVIRPHIHDCISERTALKTGIASIAEQVDKC